MIAPEEHRHAHESADEEVVPRILLFYDYA